MIRECAPADLRLRKHIFLDLQPYSCTYEKCAKPDRLYESQRDWFAHELADHRKQWVCHLCKHICDEEAQFISHLTIKHGLTVSTAQMSVVLRACESQPSSSLGGHCPLCNTFIERQEQLQRHVGRHQEDLAIFALPAIDGDDDGESDDVGEDDSASRHSHVDEEDIRHNDETGAFHIFPSVEARKRLMRRDDWTTYYGNTTATVGSASFESSERQKSVHGIVDSVVDLVERLEVLGSRYVSTLVAVPSLTGDERQLLLSFSETVMCIARGLIAILDNSRNRQDTEGLWIEDISDILQDWLSTHKAMFIEYAKRCIDVRWIFNGGDRRNTSIAALLEQSLDSSVDYSRLQHLDWFACLEAPMSWVRQTCMTLETLLLQNQASKEPVVRGTIAVLRRLTHDFRRMNRDLESAISGSAKRLAVKDVISRLIPSDLKFSLKLDQDDRELLLKGELQREGTTRFSTHKVSTLLFDNCLVLASARYGKGDGDGEQIEMLDASAICVSRSPVSQIPPISANKQRPGSLPKCPDMLYTYRSTLCLLTVYLLSIRSLFTSYSIFIHFPFTIYSLSIHFLFNFYSF